MVDFLESDDTRAVLRRKLREKFDGRIVRRDLTKKIKEGANVPVYVLEFLLRQRGSHTVIDKITVNLNVKKDCYEAEFSNLGLKGIPIDESYPAQYDRLLCGGIWCIVQQIGRAHV